MASMLYKLKQKPLFILKILLNLSYRLGQVYLKLKIYKNFFDKAK